MFLIETILFPTEYICCLDEEKRHEKQKTLIDSGVCMSNKNFIRKHN